MAVAVEIDEALGEVGVKPEQLVGWVEALAASPLLQQHHHALAGDLCIRLCDAEESRQLNAQYRAKDYPTNVLSFPGDQSIPEIELLGDLLICLPVVRSEASEQGKSFEHHLHHLVIHGVLHLLEYDHEDDNSANTMESIETRLLSQAGVADPYQITQAELDK
ncbi:MAG: rRNA maturation RNase YbeY [Pseudomonadota bacterium]